jgi:polyketide cyclase/dehydrase/lipid transport protein
MAQTAEKSGPMGRLKGEAGGLAGAMAARAISAVRDKVEDATGRLTDYTENGAGAGLTAALTGAKDLAEGKSPVRSLLGAGTAGLKDKVSGVFGGGKGKGKGGGGQKLKVTNIVEYIDVGVPLRVAYDQWTQFSKFPTFMKKVENVEQAEDEKLNWKAQVFWSHRTWEATIIDQQPDERIVWQSKGEKGHVDGAVTFHELGPSLTRIVIVLEYHPQGFFEMTGNIWRAQGRRARLELKHFQRHVTTSTLLHPDEAEGWRGVIEDGEVVKDHETAVSEEQDGEESRDTAEDEQAPEESAEYEEEEESEEEEAAEPDEDESVNGDEPPARKTAKAGASRTRTASAAGRGRARGGNRK